MDEFECAVFVGVFERNLRKKYMMAVGQLKIIIVLLGETS